MAAQIDVAILAKVAGLSTAGVFAGYTWALSRAGMPAVLDHGPGTDAAVLPKWRWQYVDGAAFSRPCSLISLLSFGYLAYQAPAGSLLRALYAAAAALGASGVPCALTLLRRANGALSIRCLRVLGPLVSEGEGGKTEGKGVGMGKGGGKDPIALTYANADARAIERERSPAWTTRRLVERWVWHNNIRTAVLVLGVVIGAYAVVLDGQGV